MHSMLWARQSWSGMDAWEQVVDFGLVEYPHHLPKMLSTQKVWVKEHLGVCFSLYYPCIQYIFPQTCPACDPPHKQDSFWDQVPSLNQTTQLAHSCHLRICQPDGSGGGLHFHSKH